MLLVDVDAEAGRPCRLRMVPVRTRPWPLSLATGATFDAIVRRVEVLSAAVRMPVARTSEGLEIPRGAENA